MNGSGEQRDPGHRPGPAVRGLGRAAARHGLRRRPGVLPRRRVRVAAFAVIAAAIFACGVLCLLAVWDFAKSGTAWRAWRPVEEPHEPAGRTESRLAASRKLPAAPAGARFRSLRDTILSRPRLTRGSSTDRLASLGVVAGTMGAFSVVNEWLSGAEADDAAVALAGEGGAA